jgi:hypothetical protein
MSVAAVWGGVWTGISSCSCRQLPNHDFWNGAACKVLMSETHNTHMTHERERKR